MCDDGGIQFFCVLQPNAFVGNPNTENIKSIIEKDGHANGFEYYDEVLRLVQSEKYRTLKPHFIDLTFALDDIENAYIDFCHLSPLGNQIIARKIADTIVIE